MTEVVIEVVVKVEVYVEVCTSRAEAGWRMNSMRI